MKTQGLLFLILSCTAARASAHDTWEPAKLFKFNQMAVPAAVHLAVDVEMRTGENDYVRYHCDRTRDLVRIRMRNGDTFVITHHKPWLRSQDWAYSGTPVDERLEKDLGQYLANVDEPFREFASQDSSQGAMVWKPLGETTKEGETLVAFEHTREHPRQGGVYPVFTYAIPKQDTMPMIRHFSAQFRDPSGKRIPVEMDYHVLSPKESTAVRQRDLLKEVQSIKARMAMRPVTVEGRFMSVKTLKIKGLIDGSNSDLTFTRDDGTSQHIVVHDGLCWTSDDADKTWLAEDKPDRSYARMIFSPLFYNGRNDLGSEGISMEELDRRDTSGGIEQHVRVLIPPDKKLEGDAGQAWITRNPRNDPVISRMQTPMWMMGRMNRVEADYAYAETSVHPPEGVALRLPKITGDTKPEDLLHNAKRIMSEQPSWQVSAVVEGEPGCRISGVVSGENCDLRISAKDAATTHEIIVGETQYVSLDGDRSWKRQKVNRDWFYLVNTPKRLRDNEKIPPFEIMEQQWQKDGGVIAHIRYRAPQATDDDSDRNNYWLETRPGADVWIKRYLGPIVYQGRYIYGSVDYERPGKDSKPVRAPRMEPAK